MILCRVIYLKIKKSPNINRLNSQSPNLSLTDENLIKNSILDEITAGKKINSQLLKKFYKLSLEEFQTYYDKMQYKLTSDLIYVESFRYYISDLVKLVFNIVYSIAKKFHLTKLGIAIKDLANYNFEWFNKKPERSYFYYLNFSNQSNEDSYEESFKLISYTTMELINDFLQIAPDIDDQFKNLSKTILLETISTMIFDKGKHFLKHIISKIRNSKNPDYNPNYKFSIKVLNIAEENIKEKYGTSSELVLKYIEKYRNINRDLKQYFHEQWRKYNPDLKSRFFKHLDTAEKTYWFGFLCSDGSITSGNNPSRKRYQISIEISEKDRSHLVKFCRTLGLNSAKIGERTKVLNNKKHRLAYIIFTCKPMFQDIENLGLRDFKEGNELKFDFSNSNLSYALLLGIYDGDGKEGRTIVYSTNYAFLLQIKNVFKIKREIRKREVDEIPEDLKFKIQRTKPMYEFALTPNLLNKMMNSYHNSLARKRKRFSEQTHVMETVKNKIRSPEILENLIKTHGKEKLAKMMNISFNTLHKLSIEWNVSVKNLSAIEKLKLKVTTKENLIKMIETNGKEKTAKELKVGYKILNSLMEEWNINAKYLNKRELLKKKIGSKENLLKLLKHSSLTQLAKKYGVGRNTLKRLCDEWEI